jgi:18S rRNA (guanine1575-N7)-methyltransferase
MLDVAREREAEGDLILGDLGEGLPFRAGAFDGAISISALQVKVSNLCCDMDVLPSK